MSKCINQSRFELYAALCYILALRIAPKGVFRGTPNMVNGCPYKVQFPIHTAESKKN